MDKRELKADELMVCYDRIIEEVEPEFRSKVSRTPGILHARQVTVMVEGSPVPCLHCIFFYLSGEEDPFDPDSVLQKKVWKQGEILFVLVLVLCRS